MAFSTNKQKLGEERCDVKIIFIGKLYSIWHLSNIVDMSHVRRFLLSRVKRIWNRESGKWIANKTGKKFLRNEP